MKSYCQWAIAVLTVIGLLSSMRWTINGRSAAEPLGFPGLVFVLLWYGAWFGVYWTAGAFSTLIGVP